MLIALIKNSLVLNIEEHEKNPNFHGFLCVEVDENVKIGMRYDGTNFYFELSDLKERIQEKLRQSAERTVTLLNLKYELTNNLGMAQIMQSEFIAYSLDNTAPTPTIDEWAEAKGRARVEQLMRVGGVVAFTKFSAIMMEQFYSKIDKVTTEVEVVEIEAILDELNGYDDLSEVMARRDEFLQRIRDVGAV